MVVGRGNDAIPTWSGFNYQGKMMLLYVLELINQIAKDKNKDIDAYSVELEKTEDFCIICDSEYKSFHQVKAYLSKDKWNSYSKAMDKLLKHRVESNNPTAKCYLTVAKEIKDWDDASNTYNVSVELYKRASKVVGVCDVRNEIDTEILVYLKSKGYSDKAEEIVYGELCLFLDDSIARMHKQDSKKRKYAIIRELKASPKRLYMALFYRQEIELLNKKGSLIKELNKSKELLTNYSNNVWSVDETLFNKIKIKAEIIAQIKTLLLNQKKEQSQLDDADKVLAQMTKARRGLIKEFYNAAESGKFDKNKCPLCGTDFTDIDSAIIETEQFIKNIHTDGIKIIEDIETQITNLFQKEIIPVLKVFLEENKVLIKMDDTLSGCKDLAVEKLQQLLDKVKISEFKSQGIEKFDIEEFSQQYENLLKELQEKEVPNKIIFQEKQIELYKSIHNTYYHNEKPYHTVGELQSKEQYVAKLFNDNLSLQLSTEEARLRKLKRDYEEYKKKTEDMTDAIKVLVGKYEDANKEYQTQLLNAIKIPLMVYSGRIIQNYPLGLGIRAIIKTNQLVFEAASKSGSDVYNILSTGQLNGLSIALLLSIKNVYGDTKGLDILLIDDPLQTIDDISAISLADLLTQQGIGQIVLSTHEEAKAALLRYKFKHAGMSVREQNMQALYMKTVTEE